jgi:hypothetical protein
MIGRYPSPQVLTSPVSSLLHCSSLHSGWLEKGVPEYPTNKVLIIIVIQGLFWYPGLYGITIHSVTLAVHFLVQDGIDPETIPPVPSVLCSRKFTGTVELGHL